MKMSQVKKAQMCLCMSEHLQDPENTSDPRGDHTEDKSVAFILSQLNVY